jgi:hypothetical protein
VQHVAAKGGTVTVNDGRWAYCEHGGAGDHIWTQIETTPLTDLQRGLRDLPREVRETPA